jgi:hypothetical protein
MKNVEMSVEGTILTLKVDLSKEFGPSSKEKCRENQEGKLWKKQKRFSRMKFIGNPIRN